jgi:hypothetical protein
LEHNPLQKSPPLFLFGDNKRNCCPGPRSPPFFPFYLVPAKESSCPAPRPSRNPTIDTIDRTPLASEKSQWPTKLPATGHIHRHVGVTRYRSITINDRRISCFGRHLENLPFQNGSRRKGKNNIFWKINLIFFANGCQLVKECCFKGHKINNQSAGSLCLEAVESVATGNEVDETFAGENRCLFKRPLRFSIDAGSLAFK